MKSYEKNINFTIPRIYFLSFHSSSMEETNKHAHVRVLYLTVNFIKCLCENFKCLNKLNSWTPYFTLTITAAVASEPYINSGYNYITCTVAYIHTSNSKSEYTNIYVHFYKEDIIKFYTKILYIYLFFFGNFLDIIYRKRQITTQTYTFGLVS